MSGERRPFEEVAKRFDTMAERLLRAAEEGETVKRQEEMAVDINAMFLEAGWTWDEFTLELTGRLPD